MFKDMRTGTKLLVLCGTFIVAILVPVYALVAEKRLAVDFARKELSGSRYLTAVRAAYGKILGADGHSASSSVVEQELAAAEALSAGKFQSAALSQSLVSAVRDLGSGPTASAGTRAVEALTRAEALASRVGDDSNLALDPDLDSYYVQNIVVQKVPTFLGQLARLQDYVENGITSSAQARSSSIQVPIFAGLLRSTSDELKENAEAAYRGNADGRLKRAIEAPFGKLISSLNAYLGALTAKAAGVEARDGVPIERLHKAAVSDALSAWATAHAELDRLLQQRIGDLNRKMLFGLVLIGLVAGLSIFIALLTHHHIVRPLERLEAVALRVREAKDYSLRMKYGSNDEIGRVTAAFNDMLAELATARNREMAQQAELARATRLTTMSEMAASIAHEVNQPLSAIVTNGNAGLRWLAHATPDLNRAQAALQRVVREGQRASEIVGSVRAMFKRDTQNRSRQNLNVIVEEVLRLVRENLQSANITLEATLDDDIPEVLGNRVQLQQVVLNLITNAIDAICAAPPDRPRQLKVKVLAHDPSGVLAAVEDSGPGIAPRDAERVFEPFFTTKAGGMGLGLSICRSIVEAHGGRLWASPGAPHGTAFMFTLPAYDGSET